MIIVAAILLINTLMLTVLSHVGSHNHYFWLLLVLVLVLVFFNYGYHCYCFCFCCWPIGSTTSAVLIRILVITSFSQYYYHFSIPADHRCQHASASGVFCPHLPCRNPKRNPQLNLKGFLKALNGTHKESPKRNSQRRPQRNPQGNPSKEPIKEAFKGAFWKCQVGALPVGRHCWTSGYSYTACCRHPHAGIEEILFGFRV